MTDDPRAVVDAAPMSPFQWRIVAVMVALNALDGFDVLSISFASPGIAASWGIDRAALGIVLSMELVGMAIGALALGGVADRAGRRATILACLGIMAGGMAGAASATGIAALCGWRVLTGLGIGGMLAATNAAVAEAANGRCRATCVALMAGGYPLGSVIGGSVAAALLARYDWHAVFVFGAAVTVAFVSLVLLLVPESIAFLMHRRAPGDLPAINRILVRMGHTPVAALPPAEAEHHRLGVAALFADGRAGATLLLTLAYFAHIMTFYFILKWIPKIVADLGHPPASAAGILVWASTGGVAGALCLGLLAVRLPILTLTIGVTMLSTAAVVVFGLGWSTLPALAAAAAAAGFVTNAGVVGLYALVARTFPAHLRATATGFVIGIGRGGAALSPALAGLLFAAGYALWWVAGAMATGSAVAALALALMRRRQMLHGRA